MKPESTAKLDFPSFYVLSKAFCHNDRQLTNTTDQHIFRRPQYHHQATQNQDGQPQHYLTVVQMVIIKKLKSLWEDPSALLVGL